MKQLNKVAMCKDILYTNSVFEYSQFRKALILAHVITDDWPGTG
jgi:hypothetical protein